MASNVFRLLSRVRFSPAALHRGRGCLQREVGGAVESPQGPLARYVAARFQGTSSKLHEPRPSASESDPAPKPISRFPIPERKTLPEDIQRVMDDVEKQSGFLPNIFKLMSCHPESFRSFFGYYDVLMQDRGNLTKTDKYLITLITSMENKCFYCTISHRPMLRLLTNDPGLTEQVIVNWQSADLSERQRAIVELAVAVCKNEQITQEHFSNLEANGLTRQDAFDIGHFSSFFALANRLAIFTDLRPNDEFYSTC